MDNGEFWKNGEGNGEDNMLVLLFIIAGIILFIFKYY